jgi:hypothetical protein
MARIRHLVLAIGVFLAPHVGFAADAGLITTQSKHSAVETIQRFEAAVNAETAKETPKNPAAGGGVG